jgi:hypothetical protein
VPLFVRPFVLLPDARPSSPRETARPAPDEPPPVDPAVWTAPPDAVAPPP